MINKINAGLYFSRANHFQSNKKDTSINYVTSPKFQTADSVSFTAKKAAADGTLSVKKSPVIKGDLTTTAKAIIEDSVALAKEFQNKEVNGLHILYTGLDYLANYLEGIKEGAIDPTVEAEDINDNYFTPMIISAMITTSNFTDKQKNEKFQKVLLKEMNEITELLDKKNKDLPAGETPVLSSVLIKDINENYEQLKNANPDQNLLLNDGGVILGVFNSSNEHIKTLSDNLMEKLNDSVNLKDLEQINKPALSIYENLSNKILKNLDENTNMVLFSDKINDKDYFLKTFAKTFADKNAGNKDEQTELLIIDKSSDLKYMFTKIGQLDSDKNHVLIVEDFGDIMKNMLTEEQMKAVPQDMPVLPNMDIINAMQFFPSNIKTVFMLNKYYYQGAMRLDNGQKLFKDKGLAEIPEISLKEAKKIFKESPELMEGIKRQFSPSAVQKAIEMSEPLSGEYPDKVQNLMKKISAHYVDKTAPITASEVARYVNEIMPVVDDASISSIKYIPDTKKRLKDIEGKVATKKEAEYLVKQIKSRKLGVKGLTIYAEDGRIGAGRKHTIKAIAGEAQVPYFEMDSGDMIQFNDKGVVQESKELVSKIFDDIKTKAQENPSRGAVLFIENFENLSIKPLALFEQQRAIRQIEEEMTKAQMQGYNILIAGSIPEEIYANDEVMRYSKFADSLVVTSPAYSDNERATIVERMLKTNKIKIDGTAEEKANTLEFLTSITNDFSFIDIKSLIQKTKAVAFERSHKSLTKADFTEGYLRLTTGRPNSESSPDYKKKMVTSHECGHALNLTFMNELARKAGEPWQIPGKVGFVTLDPRANYGGAVYHFSDNNTELSFENNFADIVCSYGGHSCEKLFYNQDGSWGITQDLKAATHRAELMVKLMGQGHNTGKVSVYGADKISSYYDEYAAKDMKVILENALYVSDRITEVYADFNEEFVDKYASKVGTGACIIDGDVFRKEFEDWKKRQPEKVQKQINKLDMEIINVMEMTKAGKLV